LVSDLTKRLYENELKHIIIPAQIDIRIGITYLAKGSIVSYMHLNIMNDAANGMPRGAGGTLHKIYHQ